MFARQSELVYQIETESCLRLPLWLSLSDALDRDDFVASGGTMTHQCLNLASTRHRSVVDAILRGKGVIRAYLHLVVGHLIPIRSLPGVRACGIFSENSLVQCLL